MTQGIIDPNSFEQILINQIARYYYFTGYMVNESDHVETLEQIKKFGYWDLWQEVIGNINKYYSHSLETRSIAFQFGKFKVRMSYSNEPFPYNDRFRIVEYVPTNKFISFVTKHVL